MSRPRLLCMVALAAAPAAALMWLCDLAAPHVRSVDAWVRILISALMVILMLVVVYRLPRFPRSPSWTHGRYPLGGGEVGWYLLESVRDRCIAMSLTQLPWIVIMVWLRVDSDNPVMRWFAALTVWLIVAYMFGNLLDPWAAIAVTTSGVYDGDRLVAWEGISQVLPVEGRPAMLVNGQMRVLNAPATGQLTADAAGVVAYYLEHPEQRDGIPATTATPIPG